MVLSWNHFMESSPADTSAGFSRRDTAVHSSLNRRVVKRNSCPSTPREERKSNPFSGDGPNSPPRSPSSIAFCPSRSREDGKFLQSTASCVTWGSHWPCDFLPPH